MKSTKALTWLTPYNEAVKILNRLFPEMKHWTTSSFSYLIKIKSLGFETWQEFIENYSKN